MSLGPITAADYLGEVVNGKRWRRVYYVGIGNPYMGQPTVVFSEEEVTSIEGMPISAQPMATLGIDVDPAALIALFDPVSGLPMPGATMTHGAVYVGLYSLYRALGAKRDAEELAAAHAAANAAAQLAGQPLPFP